MGKEVKVSVVIPTYNCVQFVTEAIDSVLNQTFKDFEILVVDDGSKDETREVLTEKYGTSIQYLYKENGGVSSARNFGIEKAKGKYIAFLDADDVWMPEKLEKQASALEGNPEIKACYSSFFLCDEKLNPGKINLSERKANALTDLLLIGNVVATPSTVIAEKGLFQQVGGFDHELSQCADWEMWIRLATKTEFIYINEPLLRYRQHDSNMSKNAALLEKDSVLLIEKGFALPNLPIDLKEKKNEALARIYMVLAGTYFHSKLYKDFIRCAWKSINKDFTQTGYLLKFPFRRFIKPTMKI
jgi:glycosyltransferase involved in cell wall biosynthesis